MNQQNKFSINLVTALSAEAKPLIAHYQLKKINTIHEFQVFANTEGSIHLIVSGIGKLKMAAAVTFLQLLTGNLSYTFWCNVGIAGAKSYGMGELYLINKITDNASLKNSYPFIMRNEKLPQASLITYDKAQSHYPEGVLMDMEASYFFQTANLFVTKEQLQVLKVVSDNCLEHQHHITPHSVPKLIEANSDKIFEFIQRLKLLSAAEKALINEPQFFLDFLERWHFTVNQKQQLQELLRRFQYYCPKQNPLKLCAGILDNKKTLQILELHLEQY